MPAKTKPADDAENEDMANEEAEKSEEEQEHGETLKFNMMAKDPDQLINARATNPNPPNLLRRFKINLRLISQAHKNKLSTRFQEVDRLYVCRKTKE